MVMDDVTNFHVCGDPSMRAMHVFMATGTRQCVPQSYQAAHSKMYFLLKSQNGLSTGIVRTSQAKRARGQKCVYF